MRLKSLTYKEVVGQREWSLLDCSFGSINLIVGKNATGKTRVLNVIGNAARLISGKAKPFANSSEFSLTFESEGGTATYVLHCDAGQVLREEFRANDRVLLTRGPSGGEIFSSQLNQNVKFEPPSGDVAVAVRRDKIQHPFLAPLTDWAARLHHFNFGGSLGKEIVAFFIEGAPRVDYFDQRQLVGIFRDGLEKHGKKYTDAIIDDMKCVGYSIDSIELGRPTSLVFKVEPAGALDPATARWLRVKESDTPEPIDQSEISQGMFRALSIIAQLNYSILQLAPECILIDDIGEGLDFERSVALIGLLQRKAAAGNVQLLMSTNDRFVMNSVPLDVWTILKRKGGKLTAHNSTNSKNAFDAFAFTGLNNFDFLAMDFLANEGSLP